MENFKKKICYKCSKEADTTLFLTDGSELNLCKSCAIRNILKNMLVTSVIPIVLFLLLIFAGTTILHNQPVIFRYFLIWVVVGIPYGLKYMFNFIHIGVTIPTMIGVIIINVFLAGLIGGFVAVWRLFKAVKDLVKSMILIKHIID